MRLTFNRPDKKNAITNAMYRALGEALDASRDGSAGSCRAVRSRRRCVHARATISATSLPSRPGTLDRERNEGARISRALARAQKPYVAAVQGLAVGVGVTMLLHCDLVYVAEDAKLTTPFVNLALVPEAASSWLLPARIGHARAYAMFALGEPIDGTHRGGHRPRECCAARSRSPRQGARGSPALATRPLGALQATKQLMRDAAAISAVMERESEISARDCKTAEAAEAFRAFAERRPPDFSKISG